MKTKGNAFGFSAKLLQVADLDGMVTEAFDLLGNAKGIVLTWSVTDQLKTDLIMVKTPKDLWMFEA